MVTENAEDRIVSRPVHPWVASGVGEVRFGPIIHPAPDAERLREQAQLIESLGYDAIWTYDHPTYLGASGVPLVACALARAMSAWDRSRPLAWWQGAIVVWLLGAFGWIVAAILSLGQRLLFAILATGQLLPPAIWLDDGPQAAAHAGVGELAAPWSGASVGVVAVPERPPRRSRIAG